MTHRALRWLTVVGFLAAAPGCTTVKFNFQIKDTDVENANNIKDVFFIVYTASDPPPDGEPIDSSMFSLNGENQSDLGAEHKITGLDCIAVASLTDNDNTVTELQIPFSIEHNTPNSVIIRYDADAGTFTVF